VVFVLAGTGAVVAQGYPDRPIRVIVPWPPGQATDMAARIVSEKLASILGQPLVIENRPGAGGLIGTEVVARALPDGYTLLSGSSGPISISPQVQKVNYDPLKDFAPISLLASSTYVLVTHPSFPAANVKEFIALLSADSGKYSYSSSGSGATTHLITEAFLSAAKIRAIHVPYKGSAPALADVISGQVNFTFDTAASVVAHVNAGRLKALGVASPNRSVALPDVPTMAEAGDLAVFDMRGWIGLLAPAAMPRDLRIRLAAESRKILQTPEVRDRFVALGLEPGGLMPDEFAEYLKKQNDVYGSVARQVNLKVD
jgi:tripartite-type tricarboxylate transporter receptor subunit TctC